MTMLDWVMAGMLAVPVLGLLALMLVVGYRAEKREREILS